MLFLLSQSPDGMLKYIQLILCFFLLSELVLATEIKEYFSKNDPSDHYSAMHFFHQQILSLDSAKAIEQLNEFTNGSESEESAIAIAWKGIYLQQKNLSSPAVSAKLLRKAYSQLDENKMSEWKSIFANYLGFYLILDKNYQDGAEYLLLSDHLMESASYKHFFKAEIYLYHIARMYFEFGEHEKSIEYLGKTLEFAKDDSKTKQFALNLMGISYAELHKYKKATHYMELVKQKVLSNKDSSGIAALNGNLGILYAFQENYEKAQPLLLKAYDFNLDYQQWKSAATNLLWLSEINLRQNKMDSAKLFLENAIGILEGKSVENIEAWGLYYRTASHFYKRLGQYQKAFNFLDSTQQIEDSILEKRDASLLSDVNIKLISDKHLIELQLLKKEKEYQAFIRNIVIALSLLISFFLLYLWYINYKKRNQEKKLYQKEQKRTLAELEDFKKRIKSKNQMLESVKSQLNQLKSESHEEEKAKSKMVQELAHSIILTEEDWQRFKMLFENIYPDFLSKVQDEFPDLTTAELRLLALLKLNLSVSEMANMLAILPESVRKTRQRLMKKLEISYHKELRHFIQDI